MSQARTPQRPPAAGKRGSQWDRKPTPMRFTDRDRDILEAIGLNRVLDRELLLWLFPPDHEAAPEHVNTKNPERIGTNLERRLTKLFRNQFVDRHRTIYGGPFLYTIDDGGAAALRADDTRAQRLGELIAGDDFAEKNRTLSTLFLTHTLAIARVRAALTVAGRVAGWEITRFDAFSPELTVSGQNGTKTYKLRPDAVLTLTNPDWPAGKNKYEFFLEADRSSMHADKMIKKFRSYEAMREENKHLNHYNAPGFRVLVVTKSPARAVVLANLLAGDRVRFKKPDEMRKLFMVASETDFSGRHSFACNKKCTATHDPQNIFADVWTAARRPTERDAIIPQPLARR